MACPEEGGERENKPQEKGKGKKLPPTAVIPRVTTTKGLPCQQKPTSATPSGQQSPFPVGVTFPPNCDQFFVRQPQSVHQPTQLLPSSQNRESLLIPPLVSNNNVGTCSPSLHTVVGEYPPLNTCPFPIQSGQPTVSFSPQSHIQSSSGCTFW